MSTETTIRPLRIVNPSRYVRGVLNRARLEAKAAGWQGGFCADIQMAEFIAARPDAAQTITNLLFHWERCRVISRPMWGGVITALRWMQDNPGQKATCKAVWPQWFTQLHRA